MLNLSFVKRVKTDYSTCCKWKLAVLWMQEVYRWSLIWKQVQNSNENDTDGAVDFFVVLYVNYGCFK